MQRISESDFEKVRKYVAIMTDGKQYTTEQYRVKGQAYQEAKLAATFLVEYYFTQVKPDTSEPSIPGIGPRPYGTTEKQRAIIAINNGVDNWGSYGEGFIKKYPTVLEEAIVHYKKAGKERTASALKQTLSAMTGEQLILVLQEYDRQKAEGNPLVMPSTEPNGLAVVYSNPYDAIAGVEKYLKGNYKEDEDTGDSSVA